MSRVFQSTVTSGLHKVVSPDNASCRAITIFRLNITQGESFRLESGQLEMNALLIEGSARIGEPLVKGNRMVWRTDDGTISFPALNVNDSFYISCCTSVDITAGENGASLYIGAAESDNIGAPFYRAYDPTLPIGEIHQIHGSGSGQREVFFTLNEEIPASRLICGFTTGGDGAWTSWPPHQHERYLEEAYCYYGMDGIGWHLYYPTGSHLCDAQFQPVINGSIALAADGYHPTVASPGVRNRYFWVLAAFDHQSRGYNHAVSDPETES